jgi:cytochrome c biogenesis protein CcmG/thiol:disulfide interchange protein DsbE
VTQRRSNTAKFAVIENIATSPRIAFSWLTALLLILAVALAAAEPTKLDSLKVGHRTYRKIIVLGTSETDLYFRHEHGIANVKLKYLDPAMQKQFGYDPKAAAEAERRQIEEDSAYHETVALELTEQAQKASKEAARAAAIAARAAASTENSLADPISDQSLLNKPAPKLEPVEWLGEAPVTEDKAVLLFFWATWSVPCRKAIAEMNSYQKKFRDKLAVVGLSTQDEKDLAEFADVKIDFSLALDPKSKLANAAGVTSVPQVLLIDAKGIVRYQGHPAALDNSILKKLLANPTD